jgi:putative ABC transport system permease protein
VGRREALPSGWGAGLKALRVALAEDLRLALGTLRSNKLRSSLTILGTVIGVASVITLVSIINGLNRYVATQILQEGSSTFWVDRFGIITNADEWFKALKRRRFTMRDHRALEDGCELASEITARRWRNANARFQGHRLDGIGVLGATGGYPETHNLGLAGGRHFLREEEEARRNVAVIGDKLRTELFPALDPVGKEVRIGGRPFEVVGLLEHRGSTLGQSQDDFVIMPLEAFEKAFGREDDLHFVIRSADGTPAGMQAAQEEVRAVLRASRHLDPGDPDDFAITDPKMLMDLYKAFTSNFFLVMVGVVSVSLVVGGIVIMNIMLVSVTERTREIGIRKAVGARRRDIMRQFLVESVLLSAGGGAIGVGLGAGLAGALRAGTGMPVRVELWSVLVGLLLASSVGIVFGIYPAARAAKLEPIAALRYE